LKVAVNRDTERLVDIAPGAQVTVEYRRKISGFVIAERVLLAEASAATAGAAGAPEKAPAASIEAPERPQGTQDRVVE
jgi:hypothetical protein